MPRTCPSMRRSRLSSFGLLSCLNAPSSQIGSIYPYGVPSKYLLGVFGIGLRKRRMDGHDHPHDAHDATMPAATATDPVCGMKVDEAATPHHAEHGGRSYAFCSSVCLMKFAADPD